MPADAPGVRVEGEWDPLGMRGTVSRNLIFKDVWVPDDAQVVTVPGPMKAAARTDQNRTGSSLFMTLFSPPSLRRPAS